ncbi:MAG TPA: rhomboid family intramembrane serine protease [Solirubrobacteraceae bacterium]
MSTGGPDLFVICKSCGSEVSPYITECPYCGNRLRKRAPKLDRDGRVTEKRRKRRAPRPSLPPLRRGEMPGIRAESRPYATIALVVAGLVGCLLWRTSLITLDDVAVIGKPGNDWWKVLTAPFTYSNTGFAFVTLGAIALYGWLLERRHGPSTVLALFAIGGIGGVAATAAAYPIPIVLGANGAALAMLCAWSVPDLQALRAGEDIDGDMLGTATIGLVVALMPLVVREASWVADAVGILAGFLLGLPLARMQER